MPDIPSLRHYPELDGKTFLLGVGGMKCATSWVFDYLRGLPGMTASYIKELHFFNTRIMPTGHAPLTGDLVQSVRHYLENAGDVAEEIRLNPELQALIDGLRMLHDDNAYFDYFARLVTSETKVLSEITPQYAVLGQDGFTYVRDFFASQRMKLKVLLILRDPVDRLWSHLRHLQDRGQVEDILNQWMDLVRTRGVIERSDYWRTIEALDVVFPAEDVLILFYEDLFDGTALQQLCEFAGLEFRPPNPSKRQNESSVKTALPDGVRQKLLRALGPQYGFCRKRFGTAIPATWQG